MASIVGYEKGCPDRNLAARGIKVKGNQVFAEKGHGVHCLPQSHRQVAWLPRNKSITAAFGPEEVASGPGGRN